MADILVDTQWLFCGGPASYARFAYIGTVLRIDLLPFESAKWLYIIDLPVDSIRENLAIRSHRACDDYRSHCCSARATGHWGNGSRRLSSEPHTGNHSLM